MSSYSSLLSLSPDDDRRVLGGDFVLEGGDADDMAAAAAVSSYLSFDDEYYYHQYQLAEADAAALHSEQPGRADDTLLQLQVGADYFLTGGKAGSTGSDAAGASVLSPPAIASHDGINRGGSISGDGASSSNLTRSKSVKIAFKTRSDVDVLDDGYRWRKYGKKMVKNSPNPRNYYRCSSEGCQVKKRVERQRDDARFVITTYEGVHDHPAAPPPSRPFRL